MSEGGTRSADDGPRVLGAVFGATFFIRFGFGLTLSVFASYLLGPSSAATSGLAESVGVVGLVSALAPLGEFSTVLFSGMAADRFGRVRVLLAGMAVAAVSLALSSLTRDPWALGGTTLVFGVASGAILASSLAVVADRSGADERGYEMGRFDALNLLGWILGFAVGLGILGALGSGGFGGLAWLLRGGAALVAAGMVVVVSWTRGYSEPVAVGVFRLDHLRAAAFRREVLVVTLPWLVIYLLLGTLLVYLGTASSQVGIPTWELAAAIGGGGLVLLLTQPYFGRLADRFGRLRLMIVGTVGFLGVLSGAALITAYGATLATVGVVAAFVLPALAYGPAALAALTDLSRSISRATTMAIYTLSISLGMLIGILASSELFRYFGVAGLYGYYAAIAAALAGLTAVRVVDVRREAGRVSIG